MRLLDPKEIRQMHPSRALVITIAGLLGPVVAAGQTTATEGSIRGTVAFTGYPIPWAKLQLHPERGKTITGRVKAGSFALEKVPAGTHRVSVTGGNLPEQYADPARSGLSIEVDKGANDFRLDLVAVGIEVGQPAPPTMADGPSGNVVVEERLRGKYVLLAFWNIGKKDPDVEEQFVRLREIRREFNGKQQLLVISLCANVGEEDGTWEAWNKFVVGKVDYGDGERRLVDDSRWWQCTGAASSALPSAPRYGVGRKPEAFLIGPDGRFVGVRIPPKDLRREVEKAVGRPR
jgi:hypothetical protein